MRRFLFFNFLFSARPSRNISALDRGLSAARYSTRRANVEWTPQFNTRLQELRAQGLTWKEIAAKLDMSLACCYRRYQAALLLPELGDFWTEDRLNKLQELALLPIPWSDIARALGAGQDYKIPVAACRQKWHDITLGQSERMRFLQRCKDRLQELSKAWSDPTQIPWDKVAAEQFDGKVTGAQLQYEYSYQLTRKPHWTIAEETTLIGNVTRMSRGPSSPLLSDQAWSEIASFFSTHDGNECRLRWEQVNRRLLRKRELGKSGSSWNQEEIKEYWKAWVEYGNDWDRVSERVQAVAGLADGSEKSAQDCEEDFPYLVRASISLSSKLEPDLGVLASSFSLRPKNPARWTESRLVALEEAVRCQSGQESSGKVDWDFVAKHVGNGITPRQCLYRWEKKLGLQPCAEKKDAFAKWSPGETSTLEQALRDFGLVESSAKKLPRGMAKTIQESYGLTRSKNAIRKKADQLLKNSQSPESTGDHNSFRHKIFTRTLLPFTPWSSEDDLKLLRATSADHAMAWGPLSKAVFEGEKSGWQCRQRFIQLMDKSSSSFPSQTLKDTKAQDEQGIGRVAKRPWTAQEQRLLFDSVEIHGMFDSWGKVKEEMRRSLEADAKSDPEISRSIVHRTEHEIEEEYWRLSLYMTSQTKRYVGTESVDPALSPGDDTEYITDSQASLRDAVQDSNGLFPADSKDDDLVARHSHPQMFISPGILISKAHQALKGATKKQRRTPFVWQDGDVEKLKRMVAKYGTSTLGWKQISIEMAIPVGKCRGKWRFLLAERKASKE